MALFESKYEYTVGVVMPARFARSRSDRAESPSSRTAVHAASTMALRADRRRAARQSTVGLVDIVQDSCTLSNIRRQLLLASLNMMMGPDHPGPSTSLVQQALTAGLRPDVLDGVVALFATTAKGEFVADARPPAWPAPVARPVLRHLFLDLSFDRAGQLAAAVTAVAVAEDAAGV